MRLRSRSCPDDHPPPDEDLKKWWHELRREQRLSVVKHSTGYHVFLWTVFPVAGGLVGLLLSQLPAEAAKLWIVIRDDKNRQYWRAINP